MVLKLHPGRIGLGHSDWNKAMAFRLKRKETVSDGLRRVVRRELRTAGDRLRTESPTEEGIHEARKSVKKVRAILQLIKADEGTGLRGGRKRLRTVNRALSHLRDTEVMKETLANLKRKYPHVLSEHTFARVRRQLDAYQRQAMRQAIANNVLKEAARDLRKLRRDARRWKPTHRRFRALEPGLRMTHRRGRRAMALALELQQSTDFHEWRKLIKALWYKLRLIDCCNAELRKDLRALQKAETCLGDEHNVAVLCGRLSADLSIIIYSPEDFLRLRRAANRYQHDLRKNALANARRIYSMKTGTYLRRVERWWKDWRKGRNIPDRKRRSPAAA
jgi:CHAD domain-containing protein